MVGVICDFVYGNVVVNACSVVCGAVAGVACAVVGVACGAVYGVFGVE